MESGGAQQGGKPPDIAVRHDLCISKPTDDDALSAGDDGFREETERLYATSENNAIERLTRLKASLKLAKTEEEFWPMATQGMAELSGAQYAFISKRMLVDNEDAAVEMPPFGTPGSCLMSQAFYYDDGHGQQGNPLNVKYQVYGCPCEHMKHEKVLLIPERLGQIFPNNPNAPMFVVPVDAYLGIPLFDREGKCFSHFGVMWSREGLKKRTLSWAFLEMIFHALEDILLAGFLERGRFGSAMKSIAHQRTVIPHDAISVAQSLKPYARSLSHELRTPMQGVVGMLDVMYATVQEAAEGQRDRQMRSVLDNLRENIEVVQDSSRRAVEAADNVVHAYDMNMGVPETPVSPPDDDENMHIAVHRNERRLDIVITGENVPINFKGHKRPRESRSGSRGPGNKKRRTESINGDRLLRGTLPPPPVIFDVAKDAALAVMSPTTAHLEQSEQTSIPPGLRHTNLRDLLQFLINDLLKVGGRPESAIAVETEGGEDIEVRVKGLNGEENAKFIQWSVASSVPDTILIEEQTLVKVISAVYSNAVKFTEDGHIHVHARLSPRSRYVVIRIRDTGVGIREEFVPRLFQPFSKEDDSLTRTSEGLGLGLMVAKGLARKLGGDLTLVHTQSAGPQHGTEFEIRVPMTPSDITSRPGTPSASPAPSNRSLLSGHDDHFLGEGHTRNRSGSYRSFAVDGIHISPRMSKSPPKSVHPESSPPQLLGTHAMGTKLHRTIKTIRRTSPTQRNQDFDRNLAQKFPLTFLVVEDNKINRKLLVNMLHKLGYNSVHEAYDGSHAVRQMEALRGQIDVILMDLWMPYMDGYEASERILAMSWKDFEDASPLNGSVQPSSQLDGHSKTTIPTILAVTADVTDGALEKAATAGMKGFLTKPFKVIDLERLIMEYCATRRPEDEPIAA